MTTPYQQGFMDKCAALKMNPERIKELVIKYGPSVVGLGAGATAGALNPDSEAGAGALAGAIAMLAPSIMQGQAWRQPGDKTMMDVVLPRIIAGLIGGAGMGSLGGLGVKGYRKMEEEGYV